MYIRPSQHPRSAADVVEVLQRNMFATLVIHSEAGMIGTHLPFVVEGDTLYAHMARANPHSRILGRGEESLVIFTGPHAYISPSWYIDRSTAPTWDYVAVHCYGTARLHDPAETRRNIERLLAVVEGTRENGWSLSDLTAEDVQELLDNVVSFEIPLARVEARFKLNQGDTPERVRTIVERLEGTGDVEIAEYIRRYNDPV
jgi:transcriptional regulator